MKIKRRLRKFADSSAAFTGFLVAIVVACLGFAATAIPHQATPVPTRSYATPLDLHLAQELYLFNRQGEQVAYTAAHFVGNVTIASEGARWANVFAKSQTDLVAWFKKTGHYLDKTGGYYSKQLTIAPNIMESLSSATPRELAWDMMGFIALAHHAQTLHASDPTLLGIVKRFISLQLETNSAFKTFLPNG
jgi:hypothetical protein